MPEKGPRTPRYLDVGSRLDTEPAPAASPEASAEPTPDAIAIPTQPTSPEGSSPDTTPTTPPSPDSLSVQDAETTLNSETLATDVEILGKHYPVRQMINEIGNQRMRAVESASANWKNMLDTPGKMRLGLARSIAEGRLNRQRRKADAVSHLSDRNLLKRRRMRKLRKAEERFQKADAKYQGRKNRMAARKENVGKNVEQRRNEYRKELRARREAALGRRALRHELRAQDAGRFEARAVLKDVPKEHLDRVGKLAAIAYASERQAARASKQEKATVNQERRTLNAIDDNRRRRGEAAIEAQRASGIVEELKEKTIPQAKERLQSLQDELDNYEGDDDQARIDLQVQIQETEDQIKIYELRELPYWEQVASTNNQRVETLDKNHQTLTTNLDQHTAAKDAARTNTESTRKTADVHRENLTQAVTEATNSGPETE